MVRIGTVSGLGPTQVRSTRRAPVPDADGSPEAARTEVQALALIDGGRLADGALVVADNVLWSGRVSGSRPSDAADESTDALRAFCARVHADRRFTATILPLGDGLLLASWRGGSA